MISDLAQYNKGLALNILAISDLHLGHSTTPTSYIIKNLYKHAFNESRENKDLDIIFIAGDVFDSLQDNASENMIVIRKFVASLLYFCKKHDILLRVLKGTKLHDWDQSYIFKEENDNHDIGCDLLYVDKVSIEYIERYGINVLYVPDEAHPTANETLELVEKLMSERNLTQVDYAIMHGAFPHQLPEIDSIKHILHDTEKYLNLVTHYIFIGHVHTHSIYERIIAHGSFDRLCHGEEGPKGFIRVNKGKVKFIENVDAMPFISLDVNQLNFDKVTEKINKLIKDERQMHIRLICSKDSPAFEMQRRLSLRYPFIKFTYKNATKKQKPGVLIAKPELSSVKTLTKDNLADEIIQELKTHYPEHLESCSSIIKDLINVINK